MVASPVIARAEWKWVGAAAALALLISSLPILVGYAAQTPDQRFVGAIYDVPDYFSHLAKIQLGRRGEFRYRSLFTAEQHPSEPIISYYITLGVIARMFGLPAPVIYEVSRLLGGAVLLAMVYKFVAYYVEEVDLRRLIFSLAIVASGVGVFLIATPAFSYPNQSPIEFWLADGYLLFSTTAFPHFGWSIAALLGAFLAWQAFAQDSHRSNLAWLIAFVALVGLIQIFELALLDAVIGLDALRRLYGDRGRIKAFAVVGAILTVVELALVWPYLAALQANPLIQVWSAQSRTLSPPPYYYLAGYGLLWLMVGAGLAWMWRRRDTRLVFPALWLGAVAVLVYTPNGIQYRWLEGLPVPLAIFAGIGLARVIRPWILGRLPAAWSRPRASWWVTGLALLALAPSTLYLVAGNSYLAAVHHKAAFLTGGQVAGIEWLRANSRPDDTVLADLAVGEALPGWTGHRSFYGHWAETMNYKAKGQLVQEFFSSMPDADRRELLRDYGVHYVFYGPAERALGNFDPAAAQYLKLSHQAGGVQIYEVLSP